MADNVVRNIAPFINDRFLITSPWWNERIDPATGEVKLHRGLDIATSGSKPVYSMLTGIVHSLGSELSPTGRGNWIIIKDDNVNSPTYGYATLYLHLKDRPALIPGSLVRAGDFVAYEGSTGYSTGIHLHVEMQNINLFNNKWHTSNNKEDYINVPEFMGIDNIKDTWWVYDGEPGPTPRPTTRRKRNNFNWVLYAKKLRNKYR